MKDEGSFEQTPPETRTAFRSSTRSNAPFSRPPLAILLKTEDPLLLAATIKALPSGIGRLADGTEALDLTVLDWRRAGDPRTARERPAMPWAAIVDSPQGSIEAYRAGAIAALPPEPSALVAGFATWAPLLPMPVPGTGETVTRRSLGAISLSGDSATVALDLMQSISELVERAVLFLVGSRTLSCVGAFGTNDEGHLLASLTQGMSLELVSDAPLAVPLRTRRATSLAFEALHLPRSLARILGSPRTGQSLLVPVSGGDTVVALIYADNGELEQWIGDLRPVEEAARKFGPSLETELLIGEAARTLG